MCVVDRETLTLVHYRASSVYANAVLATLNSRKIIRSVGHKDAEYNLKMSSSLRITSPNRFSSSKGSKVEPAVIRIGKVASSTGDLTTVSATNDLASQHSEA